MHTKRLPDGNLHMDEKKERDHFKDVNLRYMEERDLSTVSKIENETFKEPWPYEALEYELKENPFCLSFVLEKGNRLIGYAFLHIYELNSHLVNIAIDKDYRGKGFGEYFLTELIKNAEMKKCESMVLEVREGNSAAVNLYLKRGFKILRKQKKYYHDGEDALIMSLSLNQR